MKKEPRPAVPCFSPGNITVTNFCGEVSVLSFADAADSALSASVARQDTSASAFVNGCGNVTSTTSRGLPILGSAFWKLANPARGPQLAAYGLARHRLHA